MCNIAGYVGTRPAAPILLEMLKKQEGFAGGYYSGIATLHEGKIYYAKLTGDVDRLKALTEAARLPGSIGIIHSRSNSGGGDEWAHPFIGGRPGEDRLAYVANGSVGCFKDRKDEANGYANAIWEAGYRLDSRIRIDSDKYNELKDGFKVHMSDVMAQLIQRNLDGGALAADAMEQAFTDMPSEIVGLILRPEEPDRITYARINMPMMVGFAEHGAYLASTAFAFPEDAGPARLLPALSAGWVEKESVTSHPMKNPPVQVERITPEVTALARKELLSALQGEPKTFSELSKVVRTCFPAGDCMEHPPLTYELLRERKDQILFDERRVPGAFEHLDAPKIYMNLK